MQFIEDITDFIFLNDKLKPSDAILVPGNTRPEPAHMAAKLYKDGYADRVIVSGKYSIGSEAFVGAAAEADRYPGPYETEADLLKAVLVSDGVNETDIYLDREATFTLENALNIRRILEEDGRSFSQGIICCQAFHARRCKMYFEYVFRDKDVTFLVCPVNTRGIASDSWHRTQEGIDTVLGELKRCGEQFGWMLKP